MSGFAEPPLCHFDEKQPGVGLKLDIGHDLLKSLFEGARKNYVFLARHRLIDPKPVIVVLDSHIEKRRVGARLNLTTCAR